MIYAIWDNKLLFAENVAETEQYETEVRKAGSRNELKCTDPDCQFPHVIYKHGPEVIPHFAHKQKGNCDYADYDENFRKDKSIIKTVCSELYKIISSNGYKIKQEVKIPNGHTYAHLMIEVDDKIVALQIQTSATSANYNARVEEDCKSSGYDFQRIIIGNPDAIQRENHTYHIMRYQYNHSANKDLIIIDEKCSVVSQTKEDNSDYTYKGKKPDFSSVLFSAKYNSFQLKATPDKLVFENGSLSIAGFNNKYNSFVNTRKNEFEIFKKKIDEAEAKAKEQAETIKKQEEEYCEQDKQSVCSVSNSSQIPTVKRIQYLNKPKRSEIIKERLIKERKFTGERINGKDILFSLEEIKADRSIASFFEHYVKYEQMKIAVEKAFSGNKTDFQMLINRMCNATDFEKDLFKEVYNEIISKHNAPEIYTDILNYIIIEAKL